MGDSKPQRLVYAGYLGLQAVLGVLLWVAIAASGTVRSWFELLSSHEEVTDSFFLADVVVIISSGLGAWAVGTDRSWAVPTVAFAAGGVVYPTCFLLSWVRSADGAGTIALAVMLVVSTMTCWVAVGVWNLGRSQPSSSSRS